MLVVLGGLRFAILYLIFGKLHQPDSKLKRIASYFVMLAESSFMVSPLYGLQLAPVVDILLFLLLGLLCRQAGDSSRSIFSTFYANAMLTMISFSLSGYATTVFGLDYSGLNHLIMFVQMLFGLLWAVFYYYVARKMTANVPLAFSLFIILMPILALVIEMGIISGVRQLIAQDSGELVAMKSGVFLYGALFGTLLIAANMCAYLLYVPISDE